MDEQGIPGVWLELEVMGIKCPLAERVPEDWFFVRHGKKVHDRSRYQLDFRNPAVISYVNGVVDRLVTDYGIGYIKMDYNIEPGMGTELDAEETVFNMVNAMLLRIHQSGDLLHLSDKRAALVAEGIRCYKSIRSDLKTALPFWPLGLSKFSDPWVSLGLRAGGKNYVASGGETAGKTSVPFLWST